MTHLPVSRPRGARAVALAAVLLAAVGMLTVPEPSTATAVDDSAVTVAWAGGNAADLQQYQVDHRAALTGADGKDAGSGHWDDFQDLQVTVSKTRALTDEVVRVQISGMSSTTPAPGWQNFVQVMQCWGPDPLAADFAETCQYGGWSTSAGSDKPAKSLGNIGTGLVEREYFQGLSADDLAPYRFRGADGSVSKPYRVNESPNPDQVSYQRYDGIGAIFSADSSNEIPIGLLGTGTTSLPFQVQSAAAAPHLGCGDARSAAGSRCWLVVVPRGTHSGEHPGTDALQCLPAGSGGAAWGSDLLLQGGAPLDPRCTFWDDRVVVPLDFSPAFSTCPVGAAEQRVVGSELMAGALGSWQSTLCNADAGSSYNLVTNSGDLVRSQLLDGQADLVVVSDALTPDNIGTSEPGLLAEATLGYAPVANTGLVIGYVATQYGTGAPFPQQIRLTARLLAKLMTQSYRDQLPQTDSAATEHGNPAWDDAARPFAVDEDPEWTALKNPTLPINSKYGAFVVSGPQGDDAIGLLWRYVQADPDAAAFLRGEPDEWGMTINPTYLPTGHPAATEGGQPFDVASDPLDAFLRADPTVAPDAATALARYKGQQIDSVALLPFSSSLASNATRIFRADTKFTRDWDSTKYNSPGNLGAFSASPPQSSVVGQLALGPTDATSAVHLGLATAAVQVPGTDSFVTPSDASMAAALGAQRLDEATGVGRTDFAALPTDAYPLTTTLYAVADTTDADVDQSTRDASAALLEYAAADGQVRGTERGKLPEGYVPLTDAQRARTSALAAVLRTPLPDPDGVAPTSSDPAGAGGAAGSGSATGTDPADLPATRTEVRADDADGRGTTEAVRSPAQAVLGGSVLAGLAGLIGSPFLLRRRASP